MHWPFVIHQSYDRRMDIHARFGGQQQSGISTPVRSPGIFIFTGQGAGAIGYKDQHLPDGTLRYTGQGQTGDMQMISGNAAIRDHSLLGKDLLVFTQQAKGGLVRFDGLFACSGWEIERQRDQNGAERDAIVFNLVPFQELELEGDQLALEPPPPTTPAELRARAYQAATNVPVAKANNSPAAILFQRSRAVRDWVLERAAGVCEGCGNPAPFTTSSGRPFLEAHHIRRLSDGGPDDPQFVAGICPNCHRRAHFSADKDDFNAELLSTVATKEAA
ncbi:HNH endonuclease [Sphingomonas sp. 8AM]|uniref:HNH endonuclease n=1 Tax=Sphingomonas sp. 8AM TaxID=2653170 RepID=UPI0012F28656|nr:HNH endonuclease signature motif containing protein [Sphingomonas sp. 8AM]VXC80510.1 conserved hypothetical protein [Sphingomonas sp. 8AM]